MSAILGSIDQIGWKMVSPTKLRDHNCRDVDFLAGSPARLKKLMCQALENQLEQEFIKGLLKRGIGTDTELSPYCRHGLNLRLSPYCRHGPYIPDAFPEGEEGYRQGIRWKRGHSSKAAEIRV